MSESTSKNLPRVPRIRRNESKDNLRQIDPKSRDAQELEKVICRSYVGSNYKSPWEMKSVVFVENRELEERYRQKKQEMKDEGRRDLSDQYAFMVMRDNMIAMNVAKEGLRCRDIPFNSLGDSKLGVYLCRNADVQLRMADQWGIQQCALVIFKVTLGKCKVISGTGEERIEPTPNFDCHVSQYQPRPSDSRYLQVARSQVYLYEYDEDCLPAAIPRQCLPYAVLLYDKVESVTAFISEPTDSYSKRPAPVGDKSKAVESSSTEKASDTEPKTGASKMETESGLCVPRLTAGPPPVSGPPGKPSDPRLRPTDPRLQAGPGSTYQPQFGPTEEELEKENEEEFVFPPREKRVGLPPINLPPIITDTRITRMDPRLDPRLRNQSNYSTQDPSSMSSSSSARDQSMSRSRYVKSDDGTSTTKKKLSLNDYKKKVGVVPIEKSEPKPSVSEQPAKSGSIYDSLRTKFYSAQPDYNSFQAPYKPQTPFSKPPSVAPFNTLQSSEMEQKAVKEPAEEKKEDLTYSHEDIVDKPDDMMKTLNELSDPDDISQSPKVLEEPDEEDPSLAEAMKKLVEYSGNVSLFTEALKSLQESAEEMGDVLTDPEFLVKKIAETIDNLAKSETSQGSNVEESLKVESKVNQAQTKSTSVTVGTPVHHSTTEQKPRGILAADSPMARAMQSTLAELREAERAKEMFKGESYSYNSKTIDRKAEVKAPKGVVDLDKIPLPPVEAKKSQPRKKSSIDVSNIPLPTLEKTPSKVEQSDKSRDTAKDQRKERSELFSDQKVDNSLEEITSVNSRKEEIADQDHRKSSQNQKESASAHVKHEYASDLRDKDITINLVKELDPLEQDQDYRETAFWKQASEAWDTASQQGRGEKAKHKESTKDLFNIAKESGDTDLPLDKDERFASSSNSFEKPKDIFVEKQTVEVEHLDKDERLVRNSNSFEKPKEVIVENQKVEDIYSHDRDERSHSRSLSPQTIHSVFMDKDDRYTDKNDGYLKKDKKQPETKLDFSDPFGLGLEDRDERIPRLDNSQLPPVPENKDQKINTNDPRINRRDPRFKGAVGQANSTVPKSIYDQDDSDDSRDSPVLFDAYTIGKSSTSEKSSDLTSSESKTRVSDNYGDVDWRTAAAFEMGDVDLRATASSSQGSQVSSDIGHSQDIDFRNTSLSQAGPEQNASYTNVGYDKYYNTGPDSHVNPHGFGNQHNIHDQDVQVKTVAGSYSTNNANYDSYSSAPAASYHSATQYGGEYKSSSGAVYPDSYNYSTSSRPPELYQGASAVGPPNFHSGGGPSNFPSGCGPPNFHPSGGPPNFPPSGGPQNFPPSSGIPNLPPGGIQNLMHNVDLSNLKNILASVQLPSIPVVPPGVPPSPSKPEINPPHTDPATDSDNDDRTDNQPAFCTGLSFLKSKNQTKDVSRPKYSGKAIIPDIVGPPPPKGSVKTGKKSGFDGRNKSFNHTNPDGPGGNLNKTGDTRPGVFAPLFARPAGSQGIPGFDLPVSASRGDKPSTNQPFQFSEAIPNRDISTGSYQEPVYYADGRINYNPGRKRDPDRKHSDDENKDLNLTPTDKSRNRNGTTDTESWQNAILESMEQSALKIRSDDSILTDNDTPVKEIKCAKSLFDAEKNDDKTEGDGVGMKRTHEKEEERADIKVARMSKSQSSMEQDSDDEEAALVIDLSPTSKKDSQSDNSQQDKLSSRPSTASVEAGDSSTEMADCILVEDESSQKKSKDEEDVNSEDEAKKDAVLEEDDEDIICTTDMKSIMEKRRKKIVIKLKGQTKIVDPKTGKAYTENLTGSAIQVLGQPPPRAERQPPPRAEPPQPIQKIQGISTIGSEGGGRGKYRSPSPVNQPFVSSSGSAAVRGRSQSPVNQISAIGQQSNREYIHPYTGKKMVYGQQNQPNIPQSVPVLGQKPAHINVGVSKAGNPTRKVPLLPSPPASALINPPFVVVPGQPIRPGMPAFNIQPRVLSQGIRPISVPPVSQVQPRLLLQTVQPTGMTIQTQQIQSTGRAIQTQPTGMAIQTLGTSNKPPTVPIQEVKKEKSDVFDWFSDKFRKRKNEDHSSSTVTNYEYSSNSANKVIKTDPEYDLSTRRNNVEIKFENETDRKRHGSEVRDNSSESKRPRTDMSDSYTGKIEPKGTRQSGTAEGKKDRKAKDQDAIVIDVDTAASSELEDGEISDDSQEMDGCPPTYPSDSGHASYAGRMDSHPGQSIPTLGSYGGPVERFPNRPHRAASEWSELLQSPTKQSIERVRATRIESKSLIENSDLLSKSAASITKTKQKIMARSQVRTLGDWLKVELENDNIQPLQNIIPYSLNTDLSIIPKQRRRKIRLKVKNAIEQVGNKKIKVEKVETPQQEESPNPAIQTEYSPEVESDQVASEVAMLRKVSNGLKEKLRSTKLGMTMGNQNTSLIGAFATVESEMRTLMQRTCFYGYPNRRVPNELLLETEMNSFLSDIDGTFLILMMPISSKPYFKLLQMKYDIGRLQTELEKSSDPDATRASISDLQQQRQNLLRSFTGYLNKRRLQRIQEQVDKYTTVYDYFKSQPQPVPDSKLKFIRTTQMDLRQHLILVKQYMALEVGDMMHGQIND